MIDSNHITTIESPILQSLTRIGKIKYWQCAAFIDDDSNCFYKKIWWQENSKVQESTPVKVVGKNIGRSNETSAWQQTLSEFDSIVKKQRDKGYSEDGSDTHVPTKPMLAKKYKDHTDKVTFPCWVQPKLDGFRMLKEPDGKTAWTRGGKEHVRECVQHLMWHTGNAMIDGELVLAHMPSLQETAAAAKKYKEGETDQLLFCVYDIVDAKLSFTERYKSLIDEVKDAPTGVVLCPTYRVDNHKELMAKHCDFVDEGYEGTIVRSGNGGYDIGHRSNTLLKVKNFEDSEFEIVGVSEGKGSFAGKAIFECVTEDGITFDVIPNGTHDLLSELWDIREDCIGRLLTVRYPFISNDGVPCHARGVNIREDWDM